MSVFFSVQKFDSVAAHPGDGILEVVATRHLAHMTGNRLRVSHPIRIAQGSVIEIDIRETIAVQCDGEPW